MFLSALLISIFLRKILWLGLWSQVTWQKQIARKWRNRLWTHVLQLPSGLSCFCCVICHSVSKLKAIVSFSQRGVAHRVRWFFLSIILSIEENTEHVFLGNSQIVIVMTLENEQKWYFSTGNCGGDYLKPLYFIIFRIQYSLSCISIL